MKDDEMSPFITGEKETNISDTQMKALETAVRRYCWWPQELSQSKKEKQRVATVFAALNSVSATQRRKQLQV